MSGSVALRNAPVVGCCNFSLQRQREGLQSADGAPHDSKSCGKKVVPGIPGQRYAATRFARQQQKHPSRKPLAQRQPLNFASASPTVSSRFFQALLSCAQPGKATQGFGSLCLGLGVTLLVIKHCDLLGAWARN